MQPPRGALLWCGLAGCEITFTRMSTKPTNEWCIIRIKIARRPTPDMFAWLTRRKRSIRPSTNSRSIKLSGIVVPARCIPLCGIEVPAPSVSRALSVSRVTLQSEPALIRPTAEARRGASRLDFVPLRRAAERSFARGVLAHHCVRAGRRGRSRVEEPLSQRARPPAVRLPPIGVGSKSPLAAPDGRRRRTPSGRAPALLHASVVG